MDFHHHHHHYSSSSSKQSPSLALPLFSSETTSSSSSKKDMMQGVMSGYFSIGQWQELEVQALIFRHMLTGSPIPPQLLHLLLNTNNNLNHPCFPSSNFPPLYQAGGGYWGRGGMDPEPGRCKRTDGKKWRCSRDVVSGHKYCERHIHRGRNRSRKPVEIPTPATASTNTTPRGGVKQYTAVAGGGDGGVTVGHSAFIDQLHLNQRIPESSSIGKGAYGSSLGEVSENETKPPTGRILRPFFNDWPRTVEEQEVLATSLSISVPGDATSDFSLKLSTGNGDNANRGEDVNGERERGPLNWGMMWGTHQAGSMGGPLAEALRSSSVSNSSSPTSVLNQLQRGSSTTASETSYVST